MNQFNKWNHLPWIHIKERMFILQTKIYYLSKKHKPKSLYKIQNYILTSKDAKIFAVKQTLRYTSLYYKIHNKEVYRFSDLDKTLLYNSLLNTTSLLNQDFFLVESVKKYLVFLCISPEWQAKFEPQYKSSIYASRKCYFQHRLSSFFNKVSKYKSEKKSLYISQCTIKNKYFDIQYLIKKLNTLPVISKYLRYWLNHQSLAEPSILNTNLNEWTNTVEDKLNTLLNKILCNGSKWSSINYIYSDSYHLKMLELVYLCNSYINLFTIYINKFQILNTYIQKQYAFNQLENFKIHLSNKIVPKKTNINFKI